MNFSNPAALVNASALAAVRKYLVLADSQSIIQHMQFFIRELQLLEDHKTLHGPDLLVPVALPPKALGDQS
jgi:hypothetical protein